ncbi:unnamed protein product, partial [Aureobasidium pullulans]
MGSTRWPFSIMCDGEDFDGTSKLVKSTVLGFWSTMLEDKRESCRRSWTGSRIRWTCYFGIRSCVDVVGRTEKAVSVEVEQASRMVELATSYERTKMLQRPLATAEKLQMTGVTVDSDDQINKTKSRLIVVGKAAKVLPLLDKVMARLQGQDNCFVPPTVDVVGKKPQRTRDAASDRCTGQQYWIAISLGHEDGGILTAAKLTEESSSVGLVTFRLLIIDAAARFFGQAKGTFAAEKPGYRGQQTQASEIIGQLSSEAQCAKVELPPSPITQLGWKPFSRKSRPTAPSLQLLDHISRRQPVTRDLLEFSEMYLVNSSFTRWTPVMIMKRTVNWVCGMI